MSVTPDSSVGCRHGTGTSGVFRPRDTDSGSDSLKAIAVELTLNTGLQFPRGHLSPAVLPWQTGKTPDEEGARLFAWFTSDPLVQKAWAAARQANPFCRVRLRIDDKAPELQALPWELMAEQMAAQPRLHLAAADATPFSRYIAGVWQPGSAVLQRPLRMLAVVAAPPDLADLGLAPLDAAAELAVLRQAAGDLELEITPFPIDPAEPVHLGRAGGRAAQGLPHPPLRGARHGGCAQRRALPHPGRRSKQGGAGGGYGDRRAAGPAYERRQHAAGRPAAVCVPGCLPGRRDRRRRRCRRRRPTWRRGPAGGGLARPGLAALLVQAGVPAVLAMRTEVRVDTSQLLRRTFYTSLLQQGCVDLAANAARSAVLTGGLPDYGAPVLYMRLREGRLLGTRGQVLGDQGDSFWNTLLANIADGECTPFLGPGVTADLLPSTDELARRLGRGVSLPVRPAATCRGWRSLWA